MEDQLSNYLLSKVDTLPDDSSKFVVAIAGAPGSGKTTLAKKLVDMVNSKRSGCSVFLPMDGFHYYRYQLDQMPDPKEAHARRGAPFTFWGEGLVMLLQKIRKEGSARAPSFDHRVKDPVENDIEILPSHRLVILEGNYVLLDEPPWQQLESLVDERWFIDCPMEVAMERVRLRHIDQLGLTDEEARKRIDGNDRPNAELITARSVKPDRIIKSKELRL